MRGRISIESRRSKLKPSEGEVYTGISYVNILVVSVPAVVSFTGYESTDKYPTPDEYE